MPRRPKLRTLLCALTVCAVALAPQLFAQSQATTGVIEGIFTDPSGGVLPGVSVTLTNTATGFERTVITDGNGRFRSVLMPLGPYKVTGTLEGFASLVQEGIDLALGQTVSLRLTLQLAAESESILVTAEAPVIETSRTEGQVRIDDAAIEGLPNNGRNFLDFTNLTPGVAIVQGPDGDEISISGQRGINNNVSVDGADFNNPFFGEQRGGQRPPFTFNIDAVKEVLVVADGAPAEFGRSSGGFVNVVTKSGTNDVQGTAHLFYSDDNFTARAENRDGTKQPSFDEDRAQAGFTLGGPIKKDNTFFFVAWDHQEGNQTKQTEPGRIEQRVVDFMASIGSPNENAPIDRTDDADAALAKIDFQGSEKNLFTFRYNYTRSEQEDGTFDVDSWGVSANGLEKDRSSAFTASLFSTLSASAFNEFRGQFAKEWRPRPYGGPRPDISEGRPLPDTAFDFVNGYRFGMPFFLPIEYDDDRLQINNNLTWLKGDHTVKAGVEYNETGSSQTFIGFGNGRFIFGSTDGFINYVNDPTYVECSDGSTGSNFTCPAGSDITGPVLLYLQLTGVGDNTIEDVGTQTYTQKEPAVFIQDTWQPSANLTVDFGLRWEAQLQPSTVTPPDEVFYSGFIGQTVTNELGSFEFPSDGTLPDDKDLWQPRFGLAWTPKGDVNSVVRLSAGMFAARIPALMLASSTTTNGSIGFNVFRNSALTPILGPPPPYGQLADVEVDVPFMPEIFVFDKDFENPKTFAASISWEREVKPNWALLLKYNFADTDHLFRMINGNDPAQGCPWSSGLGPGGSNGITCAPPDAATGLHVVSSTARSRYWGATVGLNKRFSDNYAFQIYYTYSQDKSDDDNERDPFSYRYADINNLDAEYNYSDRHQPNRVNAWFLWSAPKGFDINLRYSYRSAQPADVTAAGDPVAHPALPAPAGRVNADGTITKRNQGKKDNQFSSLDVRVSKDFQVGDVTVQGIVDVFNLFNSANFFRPEVTNLVFNFDGTVQSGAGRPLTAQVGVRVVF